MRNPIFIDKAFLMNKGELLPLNSGVLGNHRYFLKTTTEKELKELKSKSTKVKRKNQAD